MPEYIFKEVDQEENTLNHNCGTICRFIVFSGFQLWRYYSDEQETEEQFDGLAELVEQIEPSSTAPASAQELPGETQPPEWTVNDQYGLLFTQNQDMIGWITIDGIGIDYPVMQTPDRPDFYLKRDFIKKSSNYGVPYIAEIASIDPQSDNITIYGHHMKSGKMFGVLEKHMDKTFYDKHPIIRINTRAGFGTYEIISVFKVISAGFQYHLFANAADDVEFDEYVKRCKELAFYDTGVTAKYGDKLISLSTCEYSQENGRLVVVAKMMTE